MVGLLSRSARFLFLGFLLSIRIGARSAEDAFSRALMRRPPDISSAVEMCQSGVLPVGERGSTSSLEQQRVQSLILDQLSDAPGVISVLPCLLERRVLLPRMLSDNGGRLLYAAASLLEFSLVSALLSAGASFNHTEVACANSNTLHAGLENFAQRVMFARDAVAGSPETALRLSRLGEVLAPQAADSRERARIKAAAAALASVAVGNSTLAFAKDTIILGNAMSVQVVRRILSALREQLRRAGVNLKLSGVHAAEGSGTTHVAVGVDGASLSGTTAPLRTSLQASAACMALSFVTQRNRYGSTPLHVAAGTGNTPAALELMRAVEDLSSVTPEGDALLVYSLTTLDSLGRSPVRVACLAGHDETAAAIQSRVRRAQGRPSAAHAAFPGASPPHLPVVTLPSWLLAAPNISHTFAVAGWSRSDLCNAELQVEAPAATTHRQRADILDDVTHNNTLPLTEGPEKAYTIAASASDNGGWTRPAYVSPDMEHVVHAVLARAADGSRCDFDVVKGSELSGADFVARYHSRSMPVLLKGLALNWTARSAWSFDAVTGGSLRKATFTNVGQLPYAYSFGSDSGSILERITVSEFAHLLVECTKSDTAQGPCSKIVGAAGSAPVYIFSSTLSGGRFGKEASDSMAALRSSLDIVPSFLHADVTTAAPIFACSSDGSGAAVPVNASDLPRDSVLVPSNEPLPPLRPANAARAARTPQFLLGGPGSGSPLHFHLDAFNVVAWGRKHWWVLPPVAAAYSKELPATWTTGEAPLELSMRPLECVQEAGDVLFIPAAWGHAVVNTEVTVGGAVELMMRGGLPL